MDTSVVRLLLVTSAAMIFAHSEVIAEAKLFYVHADHLGTPRNLSDEGGEIVWKNDSAPFGEMRPDEDLDGDGWAVTYNLRFPGQYFDEESGFHYNYFRDYDPSVGRYLQSDPIGLVGGANTYGYALQNPLRNTDPFGLVSWNCTSLTMGVSAIIAGGGTIRYKCESECVNGSKTISQIEVSYFGIDIGIEASMIESRGNEINDRNSIPDSNVFNGEYLETTAVYAFGIGYGVTAASWNRGQAMGVNHGLVGGFGMGAGEVSGSSQVLSSTKVACDEECE